MTRLEIFFRKYLRLASQRLQLATLRLGLSNSVTQLSWEFFFDLIKSEGGNGVEMFKNRHLNQILMATIYCCAGLLEEERSFHQICQVLPSSQSNATWSTKVSISADTEDSCDFFTFYNEIFLPPLRKRIEALLLQFKEEKKKDSKWILNELFTTAPFPKNTSYQIAENVILNRFNRFKVWNQRDGGGTKYEWQCPYPTLQENREQMIISHEQRDEQILLPQTPSNTSQLLKISTASLFDSATEQQKRRPAPIEESQENRLKKVARRLDFSEE